jgi:tRNA(fMet)-specific endonuclease VapC
VRLLLDTNAYTQLRRGASEVADRVRTARDIVMSTVVLGEVLYGFRHGSRTEANGRRLDEFLAMPRVSVLPVTETTADRYSRICTALRRKGTPIPSNDAWIAAHVMESGAKLLSFDSHFAAVDGLAWELLVIGTPG